MEHFINETIDTASLPKFEEAGLSPLQPDYKKIIIFNLFIAFVIIGSLMGLALFFIDEITKFWLYFTIVYAVIVATVTLISFISFKNKGFAFRGHDVIYRSGAIAITTTIIPYNRVQHVTLHEGILSRKFGLAAVEIFTAGGSGSDIKIPGIEKGEAEKIKQLLVGKILKQDVTDAE